MLVSYNWLQKYFEKKLPSPEDLVDLFNAHSFEIEGLEQKGNDWIIDIDVLPNRSSDCLSHRGIANEVSTLLSVQMKNDPFQENLPAWDTLDNFTVTVADKTLCPRYMAAVVRGVTVGPSPDWLKTALESVGQKSINNVVDATNYVMLDLGQPIHAFDLSLLDAEKISGHRNITIRLAKEKEKIISLTNDEYTLSTNDQLITDGVSNMPLALAGIKGGKRAELTTTTVDIVVEVANFDPVTVRKTSNSIKLHTDASVRFQNEPAIQLPAFAMREVLALIEDIAEGKTEGVVDLYTEKGENEPITVTLEDINKMLGIRLHVDEIENILIRLRWEFSRDGEEFAVTGPWERTDVTIKENVIEEIGRIYGYKNIISRIPIVPESTPKINKNLFYSEKLQNILKGYGYSEVLTYTIVDKGEVELANPFASDKSFMRMNLRSGMQKALELNTQNAPLLGMSDVKLFEIGTVFTSRGEELHLCAGIKALSKKQNKADLELLEDMKKITNSFETDMKVKIIDGIAEISLDAGIALQPEPKEYNQSHFWDTTARFEMWSAYPFMLRDIAVWVPADVKSSEVFFEITNNASALLVKSELFDEFEKDGKTSYAWHLVFQSKERTLTDGEVGKIMDTITQKINAHESWEVR